MRDLNAKIPGAPNFKYKEFIKSQTATRRGISNIPNEDQWQCIEKLAVNVLQPIRNEFGPIRISSGFRSVELCIAIGSSSTSNHARGQASDIEPLVEGVELINIIEFIYNELEYRELIAEYIYQNGWIHVAYREGQNNKQLKLKDINHNYTIVDLSYIKDLKNAYL